VEKGFDVIGRSARRRVATWLPWCLLAVSLTLVLSQAQDLRFVLSHWVPWVEVGALAVVLTPIIITGGIDLSVGSMTALCAITQAVLWQDFDFPIAAATAIAVGMGILVGGVNGLLVVSGLSPLVATLATMAFYRGLALTLSGARRFQGFPEPFLQWSELFGVATQFWLLAGISLVAYVLVHHAPFGRYCFAVGDNRLAARFAAVPTKRVEMLLYTSGGFVAALVAVVNTMRHDAAVGDSFQGVELRAIACVVVGGTLITGGRGGILRTLLGLAVISMLDIGLFYLSDDVALLTAESQLIVIGVLLIVVAVCNERLERDLG